MTCTLVAATALLLPGAGPEPVPATASSDHFLVLASPDGKHASAILARAEDQRTRIAREWLGRELPPGQPLIYIHATLAAGKDNGLTLPPLARGGSPRIWIASPDEETLLCALSHELVHVLLRERFPEGMPAWANEGAASLEDDPARQRLRAQLVSQWARTGRWPSLRDILEREAIRPSDLEAYTVSAGVVEFLVAREDRKAFLDFVEDGARTNWDAAVRRAYGFADVAALERAWHESTARKLTAVRQAAK